MSAKNRASQGYVAIIVVSVLALAFAGAGFYFYTRMDSLQNDLKKSQDDLKKTQGRNAGLLNTLNEVVPWMLGSASIEGGSVGDQLSEVARKRRDEARERIIAYAREKMGVDKDKAIGDDEEAVKQYLQQNPGLWVLTLLDEREQKIQTLSKQVDSQKTDLANAQKAMETQTGTLQAQLDEKDREVNQLNGKLTERARDADKKEHELRDEADQLRREVEAKNNELQLRGVELMREQGNRRREVQKLQAEIQQLKSGGQVGLVDKGGLEPDGQVEGVKDMTVWIDLGRNNWIRPGMKFDVYEWGKGGLPDYKAKVEVVEVSDVWSRCRVLKEEVREEGSMNRTVRYNPVHKPVMKGDFIASPLYVRDRKPVVALIGDFKTHTQKDMEALVKQNASMELRKDILTDVTFVVVGDRPDPKSNPEAFQSFTDRLTLARTYGLTTVREEEFLRFLGAYRVE